MLTEVTFYANSGGTAGGGMYNIGGTGRTSSPTLKQVTFQMNDADNGGGIYNGADGASAASSPQLTNVTFETNAANSGAGGGMYGTASSSGTVSPVLTNVTFSDNTASSTGAAMNNANSGGTSTPSLTNVIMWGPAGGTSEIFNNSATPTISYSVIEGSGGSGAWVSSFGTDGGNNLDANPMLGPLADNGGFTQSMALLAGSSAIDAGTTCSASDQRGVTRPRGAACDIGAYERIPAPVDFNGNYGSDVKVFSSGAWQNFDFITTAYTGGTWTGAPGGSCIPAPMDYDGDGSKDFTLLCDLAWHFYNDDGGYNKGIWIGIAGAVPVPADYDGDNTDEPAVFAGGAWHHFTFSTGAYDAASSAWTGLPGGSGTPSPMDYDGDGTADRSILQTNGAWHFYNANGSYNKGIWTGGVAGDVPVPGDYNGDGTDQVMVFRSGAWLPYDFATGAYLSAESVWTGAPAAAGSGTVGPAPLDYDGDAILDFTYYSGGAWHFYNGNGSYNKGIWTGGVAGDLALSRRPLP
jgi:hypothetical protein